jgi:hypothetical protein
MLPCKSLIKTDFTGTAFFSHEITAGKTAATIKKKYKFFINLKCIIDKGKCKVDLKNI